jgi:hypothetical protein
VRYLFKKLIYDMRLEAVRAGNSHCHSPAKLYLYRPTFFSCLESIKLAKIKSCRNIQNRRCLSGRE